MLASNLAAGSYTATLFFTNLFDQSVQTRRTSLAVVSAPLITSQPTNQSLLEGMTATFSVGTATNALLCYQWQFDSGSGLTNLTDGGGISGSATSSLTIQNVSPGDVGAYSVIVSNAAGLGNQWQRFSDDHHRAGTGDRLGAGEPDPSAWGNRDVHGICRR